MKKYIFISAILFSFQGLAVDLSKHPDCANKPSGDSIAFNAEFFKPILAGKKVATTRKGIRCFKTGQIVSAKDTDGKDHFKLKITKVEERTFANLDDKLAQAEDTTLADLKEGLIEIYGEEIKTSPLSVIYFKLQ